MASSAAALRGMGGRRADALVALTAAVHAFCGRGSMRLESRQAQQAGHLPCPSRA